MSKTFSIVGREDGLGNRLEEIIRLEAICEKTNSRCEYIWRNLIGTRSYEVCFEGTRVDIVAEIEPQYPVSKLSDFDLVISQKEILSAAKQITATFLHSFPDNKSPIGVHIRGTDRIGKNDHPHFMKDEAELRTYLSDTVAALNKSKPKSVYVCSDSRNAKQTFINHLDPKIRVVEPACDQSVDPAYLDLFALSKCQEIWMVSRFSSFSIIAALIGNATLVTFMDDPEVQTRFQARFRQHPITGSKHIKGRLDNKGFAIRRMLERSGLAVRRIFGS